MSSSIILQFYTQNHPHHVGEAMKITHPILIIPFSVTLLLKFINPAHFYPHSKNIIKSYWRWRTLFVTSHTDGFRRASLLNYLINIFNDATDKLVANQGQITVNRLSLSLFLECLWKIGEENFLKKYLTCDVWTSIFFPLRRLLMSQYAEDNQESDLYLKTC